jgi:hypothetical protein
VAVINSPNFADLRPIFHNTDISNAAAAEAEEKQGLNIVQSRVARFFLVQTYQNQKNIPNDNTLYQSAIIYTKWP